MSQGEETTASTPPAEAEPSEPEKKCTVVHSESDKLLLAALESNCSRFIEVGKFMTMHKRRKQRLTTRSLRQETAILDDIQNGQVKCILEQSVYWRFNAFTLENVTGGRSLPVFCLHLFHCYGLLDHFKLDVTCVWKLFTLIEEGYHSTNPYHNSIHAADVTQAMHCFLQQKKIREHLEPIEIMASLIGAVAHDMDHPGVNQPFLIATSNHLASLYQNNSVLENHHWRSGIGCVIESGIAAQMADFWPTLKDQIGSLILATDITRQNEFLNKFKQYVEESSLDLEKAEDRHFVLQIALKCADISNPCRPWDLSRKWSMKVCEEFFRQGDYERKLNLPITSMCDRQTTSIPKIQAGFLKFVVTPLVAEWHNFLQNDLTEEMMRNLQINQSKWEALAEQENDEEGTTEISEALEEDAVSVKSSASGDPLLPLPSEIAPTVSVNRSNSSRRFSVPVNSQSSVGSGNFRRDSYHFEEKLSPYKVSITDDEKLSFKDSQFLFHSSLSLNRIVDETKTDNLMLAETLLPHHSIATITNVEEANLINIVVHGNAPQKTLVRQQTYPPIQNITRTRYLSAAGELGFGVEPVAEGSAQSSSNCSQHVESAASLSPTLECADDQDAGKSDESKTPEGTEGNAEAAEGEKKFEKENLDPKVAILNYNRRSSAPTTSDHINDIPRLDMRRCSVPVESHSNGNLIDTNTNNGNVDKKNVLNKDCDIGNVKESNFPSQQEGNVYIEGKSDKSSSFNRNQGSFKTRNKKKYLQRRLSGDTEIFQVSGVLQNDKNGNSNQTQKEILQCDDRIDIKRRSSLPSETLTKTDKSN